MDHRLLIQSFTKYLLVSMFCAGLVVMAKNSELLRKRLNAKEEEKEQQNIVEMEGVII